MGGNGSEMLGCDRVSLALTECVCTVSYTDALRVRVRSRIVCTMMSRFCNVMSVRHNDAMSQCQVMMHDAITHDATPHDVMLMPCSHDAMPHGAMSVSRCRLEHVARCRNTPRSMQVMKLLLLERQGHPTQLITGCQPKAQGTGGAAGCKGRKGARDAAGDAVGYAAGYATGCARATRARQGMKGAPRHRMCTSRRVTRAQCVQQ